MSSNCIGDGVIRCRFKNGKLRSSHVDSTCCDFCRSRCKGVAKIGLHEGEYWCCVE